MDIEKIFLKMPTTLLSAIPSAGVHTLHRLYPTLTPLSAPPPSFHFVRFRGIDPCALPWVWRRGRGETGLLARSDGEAAHSVAVAVAPLCGGPTKRLPPCGYVDMDIKKPFNILASLVELKDAHEATPFLFPLPHSLPCGNSPRALLRGPGRAGGSSRAGCTCPQQ